MDSRSCSRKFPGFASMYEFADPGTEGPFRGELELEEDTDPFARGDAKPTVPLTVRWAMGAAQPGDIVWTTSILPVVMSQRVVDLLRAGGFTGWEAVPIELRNKAKRVVPSYYYLSVHGRCGPIELDRSEKVDRVFPGGVFAVRKGLYFDPLTWDSSDVFMSAGRFGWTFVVDSVKRAFEKEQVKNVMFRALDTIELNIP
jgi:hypothetical protein